MQPTSVIYVESYLAALVSEAHIVSHRRSARQVDMCAVKKAIAETNS